MIYASINVIEEDAALAQILKLQYCLYRFKNHNKFVRAIWFKLIIKILAKLQAGQKAVASGRASYHALIAEKI